MRILLVEDDADLAEVVALGLRNAAYAVDVVGTCAGAEAVLRTTDVDVACIDLGLPDGDGLDLLRRLAPVPGMPRTGMPGAGTSRRGMPGAGGLRRPRRVLVLTARDAVADRVAGLDAGADDYLVKPFHFPELLARVRALGRRGDDPGATLRVGDLVLDEPAQRVWRAGTEVQLTARELSLLRYFMHHPGRVLPAEELLEHVWDANADPFTTSVRVILSRLRRKLGDPAPIVTVTGAGYRLEEPS
jgi:two-component system copper resistance phosphate regulon response regulator CusR